MDIKKPHPIMILIHLYITYNSYRLELFFWGENKHIEMSKVIL